MVGHDSLPSPQTIVARLSLSASGREGRTTRGGRGGGLKLVVGATESTKRTRLVGRRGVEAAGCGGAGMRAVRQRNPTWALRCPAFPSLKYYSVRVERGERENRGAPCERALAAVFTPLSTYSRHPLVAGIIRSFALAEGLLRRADIRVVIYFFSFTLLRT